MSLFQKLFLTIFFSLSAFFVFQSHTFAQTPPTTTTPPPTAPTSTAKYQNENFEFYGLDENGNETADGKIEENTATVKVVIKGLTDGNKYNVLLGKHDIPKATKLKGLTAQNGEITLFVCGNGTYDQDFTRWTMLKKAKNDKCGTDDYFEAKDYYVSVTNDGGEDFTTNGQFYVEHYYPKFTEAPKIANGSITFQLESKRRPEDKGHRNNYQIISKRKGGGEFERCFDISGNGKTKNNSDDQKKGLTFSIQNNVLTYTRGPLEAGTYSIHINEQPNDRNLLSRKFAGCNGGMTYYEFDCTLSQVSDPNDPSGRKKILEGKCTSVKQDPNKSDANNVLDALEALNKSPERAFLPCEDGRGGNADGSCDSIQTAIGSVNVHPLSFITTLFRFILGIVGIILLFILLINGYRFMISGGDKQAISDAREKITSGILGLLFIIFSIVILEFITRDILKIPGFN